MRNLRTTAWILGSLLTIPACDGGGSDDSGKSPDVQEPQGDDADQVPDPAGDSADDQKPDKGNGSQEDDKEPTPEEPEEDAIDCSALKVTGDEVGQVPENLTLLAANGEQVSLHDYCNDVLLIMTGTAA